MTTLEHTVATDTPKPGVYHNIPMEVYQSWKAINWHTLQPFMRSAKEGRFQMLQPDITTDPQNAGAAFHDAMRMTESEFREAWAVMPEFEGNPRSKAYQDQAKEWQELNRDKPQLEQWEMGVLLRQQKAVREHLIASKIVSARGRYEISMVWTDKETGELCKVRIDLLCRVPAGLVDLAAPNPTAPILAMPDFKTCASTYFRDPNSERAKYSYHGQMAWYQDGIKALENIEPVPLWIWVESPPKSGPNKGMCAFDVAVMDARPTLDEGRKLCRKLLNTLINCRKTGRWPGIADAVVPAILKPWEVGSKYEMTEETENE